MLVIWCLIQSIYITWISKLNVIQCSAILWNTMKGKYVLDTHVISWFHIWFASIVFIVFFEENQKPEAFWVFFFFFKLVKHLLSPVKFLMMLLTLAKIFIGRRNLDVHDHNIWNDTSEGQKRTPVKGWKQQQYKSYFKYKVQFNLVAGKIGYTINLF